MRIQMLDAVARFGAIAAIACLNLPGAPVAAGGVRSDFPDDLSDRCRRAIDRMGRALESRHRVSIQYAAVNPIPDDHPYYPSVYDLPAPEEARANPRVDRLYLSLVGDEPTEVAVGDLVQQSTALNLLYSPQLLRNYTRDAIEQCETLALVNYTLTERQQRQFGIGEAALVEYRCRETARPGLVPCWDFDGGAGTPGELR